MEKPIGGTDFTSSFNFSWRPFGADEDVSNYCFYFFNLWEKFK